MNADMYVTVARAVPWKKDQIIGYYTHKSLAEKVADIVRTINMPKIPGGVDVTVMIHSAEVVQCRDGTTRLKETPMGCITLIHSTLNNDEMERITSFPLQYEVTVVDLVSLSSAQKQ